MSTTDTYFKSTLKKTNSKAYFKTYINSRSNNNTMTTKNNYKASNEKLKSFTNDEISFFLEKKKKWQSIETQISNIISNLHELIKYTDYHSNIVNTNTNTINYNDNNTQTNYDTHTDNDNDNDNDNNTHTDNDNDNDTHTDNDNDNIISISNIDYYTKNLNEYLDENDNDNDNHKNIDYNDKKKLYQIKFNFYNELSLFYKNKLKNICNMLENNCNHIVVEDSIDISPDISKNIKYCEICETTFK